MIKPPAQALEQMVEVVREMHTASPACSTHSTRGSPWPRPSSGSWPTSRAFVPEARKAPLCGNSVATDRGFLARDMPALDEHLHYRIVDVSSIKELARRWYPRVYFNAPTKHGGHRALADIRESIQELKYYRAAMFVEPPGPDTDTARALATSFTLDGAVGPDDPPGMILPPCERRWWV